MKFNKQIDNFHNLQKVRRSVFNYFSYMYLQIRNNWRKPATSEVQPLCFEKWYAIYKRCKKVLQGFVKVPIQTSISQNLKNMLILIFIFILVHFTYLPNHEKFQEQVVPYQWKILASSSLPKQQNVLVFYQRLWKEANKEQCWRV